MTTWTEQNKSVPTNSFKLLKEDGYDLLQENGYALLLDQDVIGQVWANQQKS